MEISWLMNSGFGVWFGEFRFRQNRSSDYFLFPRFKIPMKGTRYYDMPTMQIALTKILELIEAIPKADVQKCTPTLVGRAQRSINAEGTHTWNKMSNFYKCDQCSN